jgi:hypothetical protein
MLFTLMTHALYTSQFILLLACMTTKPINSTYYILHSPNVFMQDSFISFYTACDDDMRIHQWS